MTEPQWLDESEARAWRGYIHMTELLRAAVARDLLQDTGLSEADYTVLVHLSEAPGRRLRISELASELVWSKSRLSHQVTRMQERGLLRRQECPTDARGWYAVLTPRGLREIERAAPHHVESVRRRFLDGLTRDQLRALAEISEAVVAELKATD